ncbi:glycosyltransferase family 2 protein [Amylibacter sp.]|nr:glycosyltransferase family 2 protein [Amylibacter sp.]
MDGVDREETCMPSPHETIYASCVIPCYNAAETIHRALDSVLRTPGIGEVIVIDDGSSDDTALRVEALAQDATIPMRLIKQKNGGASAARNTGIAAASEGLDWITFLDADDEMLPEAITSKQDLLSGCADPNDVDAVYGSYMRSDSGNVEHFAETMNLVDPDSICLTGGFPGHVASYIFRRETLLASGGFRTELIMFEDIELILRLIADGARVIGCNIPGFNRHYIPNSLTRGCAGGKRLRIERQFLDIATKDQLMSRPEIFRRHLLNRTKQLFYFLTGR